MNYNPNKIITLYHNGTENKDAASWRNNLNRIMHHDEINAYNPVVGGDPGKWTVNSNVDLLIPDRIPSLATGSNDNFDSKAIEGLLKKFSSSLEKAAGLLLPGPLSLLSNTNAFLTMVNAFKSMNSSEDSGYMFDPWWTRIPTYTKTPSPLEFTCQFNFSLGQYGMWNALEEVVKPILNLAAPSMVRLIDGAGFYTPFPTIEKLALNMLGSSVKDLFSIDNNLDQDDVATTSKAMDVLKPSTYNIKFGNVLYFPNVIMKVAEDIKLSSEVDQHGYPVQGSITLLFSCLTPLTLTAVRPDLMATRFFYTPQDK